MKLQGYNSRLTNICFLIVSHYRSFWHNERIAMQFEHRSVSTTRDLTPKKRDFDELLPVYNATVDGAPGARRQYDWSFRFQCRRYRNPKDLSIKRDSVGTGCLAEIRMQKLLLQDKVRVVYSRVHNHKDTPQERAILPMAKNELDWIKARALEGMDWKAIKARLRVSKETMDKV